MKKLSAGTVSAIQRLIQADVEMDYCAVFVLIPFDGDDGLMAFADRIKAGLPSGSLNHDILALGYDSLDAAVKIVNWLTEEHLSGAGNITKGPEERGLTEDTN